MFNNYDIFNFTDINKNSEIDQKLSDNNNQPILEDLLIEEGIIEELQNKNEKLIKYLNKDKIKQMLDYIIKEPKEEDQNKGYKFPFVVSKLFNVEDTNIMKYFFKTNKELIDEKKEKDENMEKKEKTDLYFDLYQDEDKIDDKNIENINDKIIDIDEINININNEDNEDNCNYEDFNLENNNEKINNNEKLKNDEVNISESNNNKIEDNNINEVNTNNNKDKKEDLNEKIKNINLFNSPNSHIDNLSKNERYTSQTKKESEKEKQNEENNNKKSNIEEKKDNYPEDKIEILDYFFSFLIDDSELNYVLCGYFSSLMMNLLNMNSIIIIKYIFLKRKDILKRLVYHSYRKSIAETLCRIIKYEDKFSHINNENKDDYDEYEFSLIRLEIIKNIFEKIDINMDSEKLYSISFIVNDLTQNKKVFESILNNKIIIQWFINKQLDNLNFNLINNSNEIDKRIIYNQKNNFSVIIDIIINWLTYIKVFDMQTPMLLYEVDDELEEEDFVQQKEKDNVVPEVHHTLLSQALFDVLPNLIKNNFNKLENEKNNNDNDYIFQSFNDYKLKPLGLYKIKIVEILTSLISYSKNIPNEYDNLLINSKFFENSINYIFEYEWNNLYQEAIFQFLKQLLSYEKGYQYHELSADYLFSKINILNKIITNLSNIKNNSNDGNTGNGYTAFLISLSYKINTIIGGNYLDLNKSYTREGSITFMNREENHKNEIMNMIPMNKAENEKDKKEELKVVNCMKKFCNEEWNNFFKDNISEKIKLYEEKLCNRKNSNYSFGDSKDDLFVNGYNNDDNNNNNETENLLGRYKGKDQELFENFNRFDENEDIVNNGIDNDYEIKKKDRDMAKFKDMEINLNDFNFSDYNDDEKKNDNNENINNTKKDGNNINNENILDNKEKENEDKNEVNFEYNSVNYWKNSLEKENNSYLNNLGEDALKDLIE